MKTRENQVQTIDIKEVKQEVVDKMEQYKQEFIEFMVESDVLKFGEFTLKSGRKSPFFMNAGAYVTGSQLMRLGEYYAKAIHEKYGDDFDVLFGPAYKGIPISVVTAVAFSILYGKEVRYCSDRKEEKDHGADKGSFLGSSLKDVLRPLPSLQSHLSENHKFPGFHQVHSFYRQVPFPYGLKKPSGQNCH